MPGLGLIADPALATAFATTVATGGLLHGAFYRNSPVFGRVLRRLPEKGRQVALTFDDGPNAEATPLVLDVLAWYKVPATFFVLGGAAGLWPELVQRMVAERHEVGNHGQTHRKLHLLGPAAVRAELEGGANAIERACGVRPRFFRAPHGFRSPWVTTIAASLGETTVGWSLGVWDSDRPGEEVIAERVVNGVAPGSIILLHDGDGYRLDGDRLQTARALPAIIERLRARGYEFVRLPRR
jgi:peptidoglycan/xylan/chitin deacetylase (PgdA/CDA1 family)